MIEDSTSKDSVLSLYPYDDDRDWAEAAKAAPEYLIIVDESLKIQFVNRVQPGYQEPRGTNCLDYIGAEYHSVIRNAVDRALQTGLPQPYQLQGSGPDGLPSFYSVWATVVMLPCGGRHVALAATDVTHSRRIERKLEISDETLRQTQKMRALGQLTGGVAHDFNNLLTVILGSLSLAQMSHGSDSPHIGHAIDAAERATSLTQRLLAFGRNQSLQPRTLDLNHLLRDFVEVLHRTLGDQITVQLEITPSLWTCRLDAAQLESAILNLAINARDAMGPGGGLLVIRSSNVSFGKIESKVRGLKPGDYVELCLVDDGPGMDEETKQRAFEPFFTTKDVGRGSGLGLSMVYGFVRQSGGQISLEGDPGEGTTVRIHFPASKRPARERTVGPNPSLPSAPGSGQLILVVEDQPAVAQVATQLLSLLGYSTLWAETAEQALMLLAENLEVKLLFTDVFLPGGMTGVELAQRARNQRADLKVVFTSGYDAGLFENSDFAREEQLLTKPYRAKRLAEVIARAFES